MFSGECVLAFLITSGLLFLSQLLVRKLVTYVSIREILYPNLEDHDLVKKYPPVQGMQKDLFFFTHTNREKAADEGSVSKVNTFEVS